MHSQAIRPYLSVALFALTVAAATGALLRFGLGWGMPDWALNYTAIRHAHSHLMYFGWATLGLMALIWRYLGHYTGRDLPRSVHWQMGLSAALALLSFPAFWANGYGLTRIGALSLPLGSIVALLNAFTWFHFAWLYRRESRRLVVRSLPVQLWDWAILLLLLSSGGAAGLIGLVLSGGQSLFLQQVFLHLFLDLFAVGWFTLALLGLLWARLGRPVEVPGSLPVFSLALAIAPTFFLGIPPGLVPTPLFWAAAVANAVAALLLFRHIGAIWQRRERLTPLARFGLAMLAVHGLIALVLLWPGVWEWSGQTQLRVYFLHNFLLGWLSSGLLALLVEELGVRPVWSRRLGWVWIVGVGGMLALLLALGLLQFVPVSALVLLRAAAWISFVPAGVAGIAWLLSLRPLQAGPDPRPSPSRGV